MQKQNQKQSENFIEDKSRQQRLTYEQIGNNKKKKNLKILPEYVWNFKNHKLPTLSNLGDEILSYIKGVDRINSSIQEKESGNTT